MGSHYDDGKIVEVLSNYIKLKKNIEEYENLIRDINMLRGGIASVRNTKVEYLRDIYSKYNTQDVLNCYGDIFFIDSKDLDTRTYIGRRILWNLKLSKERYLIQETIETEEDGEYVDTDYEIEIIKE